MLEPGSLRQIDGRGHKMSETDVRRLTQFCYWSGGCLHAVRPQVSDISIINNRPSEAVSKIPEGGLRKRRPRSIEALECTLAE